MGRGYAVSSSDNGGSSSFLHYDLLCKKEEVNNYIEVKKRRLTVLQFLNYASQGFIYENVKYQFLKDKASYYINVINLNGIDYIFS